MRATLLAAALTGALLASGCGIKGPLYLPDVPKSAPDGADHSKAPTAAPASK